MRKLFCLLALAGGFLLSPTPPADAAQTVVVRHSYPHHRHHHYYRHHYGRGPYSLAYPYRHR